MSSGLILASNPKFSELKGKTPQRLNASPNEEGLISKPDIGVDFIPAFSNSKKSVPKGVNKIDGDGTTLYGSLISSSATTDFGIYSYPASGNTKFTSVYINSKIRANGGGAYADGKYYVIYYLATNVGYSVPYYRVYDTTTWEEELYIKKADFTDASNGMTYDMATNTFYATSYKDDSRTTGYWLSTFDTTTGDMNPIATIERMTFIACNPQGQLYGVKASDGCLYKINKKTAELTLVGNTNLTPAGYLQSGTFDPNTGKLYWSAFLSDNSGGLYEVDTNTGAASLISTFPGNEEIVGMYVPEKQLSADVPAKVEDLNITTSGDSNKASLDFTVPSKTYGGSQLTGSLTASVYANGELLFETPNLTAGAKVSKSDIALPSGKVYIKVVISNAAGIGEKAAKDLWIGYDAPKEITGLTLTSDGSSLAKLSWKAPTEGIHGGSLNTQDIKYEIVRNKIENKTTTSTIVSSDFTGTEFTETIDGSGTLCTYSVTPYTTEGRGNTATSNEKTLFSALSLPYIEEFNTESAMTKFNIIDNNNDGCTWEYDTDKATRYHFSNDNDADDWLISPSILLEANKTYRLMFKTKNEGEDFPEKISVYYGKGNDIKSQNNLIPSFEVTGEEWQTLTKYFTPAESGKYNFSFHAESVKKMYYLYVDSIALEESANIMAPDSVTSISAKAADLGALEATISFTSPSKTITGAPLGELTSISIYRGKETTPIYTITDPKMNATINYTDKAASQGTNSYKIVPANSFGAGRGDTISVYVGIGTPQKVNNPTFTYTQDGNTAHIAWEAPTAGTNGTYIDPKALTYSVVRNDNTLIANSIKDLTTEDKTIDTQGSQKMIYYGIVAKSIAGFGEINLTNFSIIGNPYPTPFYESVKDGSLQNKPWSTVSLSGNVQWITTFKGANPSVDAQDGDNGLLTFNSYDGEGECRLISPKLDLTQLTKPELRFWMYHYKKNDAIQVEVSVDGGEFVPLGDKLVNLQTSKAKEWVNHKFSLDAYKNCKNITVALRGISDYGYNIHIDNIMIDDFFDNDLSTAIEPCTSITPGKENFINVKVHNKGTIKAGDFTLRFFKDGTEVNSSNGSGIEAGSDGEFSFIIKGQLEDVGKSHKYYAKVEYPADENLRNNVSDTLTISTIMPTYPAPQNLSGVAVDKKANLKWEAPAATQPTKVLDDVESYESFIIDNIGDWTVVDRDKGTPYFFDNGSGHAIEFKNYNVPQAFIVYNPFITGQKTDGDLAPHSGKQFFLCMASQKVQNDDWLISPELAPKSEFSFYAKALSNEYDESFIVRYSTSDKNPDSFVAFNDNATVVKDTWTQYKYTLPENAKYIAIQCVSNDKFGLMIDDISYAKVAEKINLLGYNIYCNDKQLNTTPVTEKEYVGENVFSISDKFGVSALYEEGESYYSNLISIDPSEAGLNAAGKITIYSLHNSIVVEGADGLNIEVIAPSGINVANEIGTAKNIIPLENGIYIVKVGNAVKKVQVK